jgi:hypothetical protein
MYTAQVSKQNLSVRVRVRVRVRACAAFSSLYELCHPKPTFVCSKKWKEIAKNEKNKPENKDLGIDLENNGFRIVINDGRDGCKKCSIDSFYFHVYLVSIIWHFFVKVKVYTTFISIFLVEDRWAGLQASRELGQACGDKP